ncbi:protein RarD [Rhodospirillum rubrum]|nr:protein RarD [Rhodospirillum rubrum]MBK1675427.1 protein RarD [Rhodospirillum rubrum]
MNAPMASPSLSPSPAGSSARGVAAALGAYGVWGISPLFFKAVSEVSALEILSHRVLWAMVVMGIALGLRGELAASLRFLANRRVFLLMLAATMAISINWLTFIHAATTGHAMQGSLGYYIFPLVTVVLGRLVLGEEMSRRQGLAVALAAAGVGIALWRTGSLPWISLTLALSFALYGLIRKTVSVPPLAGLFIEALLLSPVLIAVLAWIEFKGGGLAFFAGPWGRSLWLMALGPLTAVPLFFFTWAARRLRLSTLGVIQYTNPTIQFALAALVFKEPVTTTELLTFGFIWAGVALYLWPVRKAPPAQEYP